MCFAIPNTGYMRSQYGKVAAAYQAINLALAFFEVRPLRRRHVVSASCKAAVGWPRQIHSIKSLACRCAPASHAMTESQS